MHLASWVAAALAVALIAGCQDNQTPAAEAGAGPAATAEPRPQIAEPSLDAPGAAPSPAETFDLNAIPVSDAPLGEWPYIAAPAGYIYSDHEDLKKGTRDIARVPVWTGNELLWIEGRAFENHIFPGKGKTYSTFEVRQSIERAVTALGGKRISTKSFDQAIYEANKEAVDAFTSEFDAIDGAYSYDETADTYVIRRADKAIWVVSYATTSGTAAVLVVEGPLPTPDPSATGG